MGIHSPDRDASSEETERQAHNLEIIRAGGRQKAISFCLSRGVEVGGWASTAQERFNGLSDEALFDLVLATISQEI